MLRFSSGSQRPVSFNEIAASNPRGSASAASALRVAGSQRAAVARSAGDKAMAPLVVMSNVMVQKMIDVQRMSRLLALTKANTVPKHGWLFGGLAQFGVGIADAADRAD